ncbi:putative ubiquitin-conjugating enzyme E2 [Jaminaea rosea]|uniref:Putative ubiquitin-conjugating enzyme E2 n=1 Tax=Jaminaea rosea TaxID=1569628 RepID=A0A316UWH7_9BASI|nr:putative ubiquitin-conjugating enzyme E2 [Jaminaea rosea]PWN29660.1 putative ubiquitin-conjugating enzyme E2 [Jaminaea rosea]
MRSPTLRRLMKEFESIRKDIGRARRRGSGGSSPLIEVATGNPDLLELRPWDADGEDLFEWYAVIKGPKGGNYEGGIFELTILIPPTYPSKPPTMRFKTKIWHPNISWKTGEICLDVLASQWSPAWQLSSACTAVIALLDSPEPDSPLNVDAATVYRTGDQVAYGSMCSMYTRLYAADVPATIAEGL